MTLIKIYKCIHYTLHIQYLLTVIYTYILLDNSYYLI